MSVKAYEVKEMSPGVETQESRRSGPLPTCVELVKLNLILNFGQLFVTADNFFSQNVVQEMATLSNGLISSMLML